MATIGQVTNRNTRLIAIFKVMGMYLFTVLLLVWIFRANVTSTVSEQANPAFTQKITQLQEDTTQLIQMITTMNQIAVAAKNLVELDQLEFETTGSKLGEIHKTEGVMKRLFTDLQDINLGEELLKERVKLDEIYSLLQMLRGKIQILREKMRGDKQAYEEKIKKLQDDSDTKNNDLKDNLNAQINTIDGELDETQSLVADLRNQLAEKQKVIEKLSENKANCLAKVITIKEDVDQGKLKPFIRRKWNKLMTVKVSPAINELKLMLEQ